jgi:excisionase family DNA binding protein
VSDDVLMPVPEAAPVLGVDERMVRRLVAEKRIPYVKIGRHVRLRRSDLLAYVEANTVPARVKAVGR